MSPDTHHSETRNRETADPSPTSILETHECINRCNYADYYETLTCTWSKWFSVRLPRSSMACHWLVGLPTNQICCW